MTPTRTTTPLVADALREAIAAKTSESAEHASHVGRLGNTTSAALVPEHARRATAASEHARGLLHAQWLLNNEHGADDRPLLTSDTPEALRQSLTALRIAFQAVAVCGGRDDFAEGINAARAPIAKRLETLLAVADTAT